MSSSNKEIEAAVGSAIQARITCEFKKEKERKPKSLLLIKPFFLAKLT